MKRSSQSCCSTSPSLSRPSQKPRHLHSFPINKFDQLSDDILRSLFDLLSDNPGMGPHVGLAMPLALTNSFLYKFYKQKYIIALNLSGMSHLGPSNVSNLSEFSSAKIIDLSYCSDLINRFSSSFGESDAMRKWSRNITHFNLRMLRVSGTEIVNRSLVNEILHTMPCIRGIDMAMNLALSDSGLAALINSRHCRSLLSELDVSYCNVTDTGAVNLGSLKNLVNVKLSFCTKLTNSTFSQLSIVRSLCSLDLSGTQVDLATLLRIVKANFNLQVLDVWDCMDMSDFSGCRPCIILENLPRTLSSLRISMILLDNESMSNLIARNTDLKWIELQVADDFNDISVLAPIAPNLMCLTILDAVNLELCPKTMKLLQNVHTLNLNGCKRVDSGAMAAILDLPKLKTLHLDNTVMSFKAFWELMNFVMNIHRGRLGRRRMADVTALSILVEDQEDSDLLLFGEIDGFPNVEARRRFWQATILQTAIRYSDMIPWFAIEFESEPDDVNE
jgi:hypothetical protein